MKIKYNNIRKKISNLCILLVISLYLTSCNSYYELYLEKKNPAHYCFDANIQDVKSAIKNGLGNYQIPGLALYFKEDNRFDILNINENRNDAYLRTFLEPLKSKIYFNSKGPLLYDAEFHLHLDSLGKEKTKITINTIKSEVLTGRRMGIGDNFTLGLPNYISVPPSTIEEYEILLIIGKQLNQTGMPECNYPPKGAKKIRH